MKSCKLCNEKPLDSSIFCIYHEIAYDNLKSGYKIWNDRYDKLDWKNYLRTVSYTHLTLPTILLV